MKLNNRFAPIASRTREVKQAEKDVHFGQARKPQSGSLFESGITNSKRTAVPAVQKTSINTTFMAAANVKVDSGRLHATDAARLTEQGIHPTISPLVDSGRLHATDAARLTEQGIANINHPTIRPLVDSGKLHPIDAAELKAADIQRLEHSTSLI